MKQNSRKFSVCSKIKRQFFYNHWKFRKLLPHPSDEILPTEIDFAGVDFLRLATHWQVWHRVRQTKLYCCFKQCFTVSHANWKRSSFKLKHCSSGVWSNWKCWIQLDLAGSSWSPATRIGYGTLPVSCIYGQGPKDSWIQLDPDPATGSSSISGLFYYPKTYVLITGDILPPIGVCT